VLRRSRCPRQNRLDAESRMHNYRPRIYFLQSIPKKRASRLLFEYSKKESKPGISLGALRGELADLARVAGRNAAARTDRRSGPSPGQRLSDGWNLEPPPLFRASRARASPLCWRSCVSPYRGMWDRCVGQSWSAASRADEPRCCLSRVLLMGVYTHVCYDTCTERHRRASL
jgi:hypothetical protein